jgi:ProP effector
MSHRYRRLIPILCERFPAAFSMKQPPPLKVGIVGNITTNLPDINARHLESAMAAYCNRPPYLRALTEGAPRVDLDGNPAGTVTASEATHATKILAERLVAFCAKREARKARERELEAKRLMKRQQAEAEEWRQEAQAARADIRKQPMQATATRPVVVVKINRPRFSLRPSSTPRAAGARTSV